MAERERKYISQILISLESYDAIGPYLINYVKTVDFGCCDLKQPPEVFCKKK